jgi:tRNA uridine 5-carbamoylmethylation protein Kti12
MSDTSGADAAASQSFAPSSESSVRSGADRRLVIVLCGLPARGKTYISRKLTRYLCWLGYSTRCFNIGNYRREKVGASMSSDFFDPTNSEFVKARNECALSALSDMFSWFRTAAGQVGIYDGTNSTRSRRAMVAQEVHDMVR